MCLVVDVICVQFIPRGVELKWAGAKYRRRPCGVVRNGNSLHPIAGMLLVMFTVKLDELGHLRCDLVYGLGASLMMIIRLCDIVMRDGCKFVMLAATGRHL